MVDAMAATGAAANDNAAIEPTMAMVRDSWVLLGEGLPCLRTARIGLTPISVKAPVKGAVSRGSKAAYPRFGLAAPITSVLCVLLIEDERTLAGFIEQALRAEGYAVTIRHDGPSGEAAALTGDYALVLLGR